MATKVKLRRKPITQGRATLFLDYYPPILDPETMKMIHKEYLGIYIFQEPQNEIQREYNADMLLKAEAIQAMRIQAVINEEFGFLDKRKQKGDFLAYFRSFLMKKDPKWKMVYAHFEKFTKGKCTFGEVNVDLCRKFREYLLNANQLKFSKKKLERNSAAGYYSTFRGLLKIAYRDKMIRENVNDFLEKIEYKDVKKEFLTAEELGRLAGAPCEIPVLKAASLFACLTGLRISDILKLDWKHIVPAQDGGYCMRLRTEKTETETTLPISDEALELCGERSTGKVFKGLERSMIQHPLQKWLKSAGIEKHITFHCFRHTFATLQIALGTDIFTVSKMLTHKNVSTTQIYAELVNEKKRESANRISLKKLVLKED
ncbi:site-specific integrase [Coprobacter sp. LH1063]|uniref:Site-specific integrase n=1 Tax=Coprobacter tertius TaxID=2944915 RepID=A0ABT1MGG0_9BACT|nr:site-specific integrase [Coprobacter tertius]MCP9611734.1 site-specific integrase [Coprobacter tertius]